MTTPDAPSWTWPRPPSAPLTRLVGRDEDLSAVRATLLGDGGRLLTLVGPPGVGKTRLALAAVEGLRDAFPGGAWFVPLAPLDDPALVFAAVAGAFGAATDTGAGDPVASLVAALRPRRALLALDNFEHLLGAAPLVGTLLAGCPELRVLVTSRRPLRLAGEREYPVHPLPVPDAPAAGGSGSAAGGGGPDGLAPAALEALRRSPAVALFVQRAQDARPDFRLDAGNGAAVAGVCRRLDGLPLALELAAARTKLLPPAALLAHLAPALPLLAGGPRDAPARQQTLRQTIAWSDALLSPRERRDLRRLAVFAGGWTVSAAGAVLGDAPDDRPAGSTGAPAGEHDALDRLGALLDHSLIHPVAADGDPEPRFGMLETMSAFALEGLAATGEVESIRRRHAAYFLRLAEQGAAAMHGPQQGVWYDRLEYDHDNLRASLRWALDAGETETAVRLLEALRWFWEVRGHIAGGRRAAEATLASPGVAETGAPWRRRALVVAAQFCTMQRDFPAARAAHLLGAAEAHTPGTYLHFADQGREQQEHQRSLAAVRRALQAYREAPTWIEEGRSLPLERAVDEALLEAEVHPGGVPRVPRSEAEGGLTPREREVAALVARGRTNRQIAAQLVIAERTAMRHVEHILNKLGVHSRAEIAAWAARNGLDGPP